MVRIAVAALVALVTAAVTTACEGSTPEPGATSSVTPGSRASSADPPSTPASTPAPTPHVAEPADPADVRASTAMAAVRHLAGRIGPRHGTSAAYRRAVAWTEARLTELGWRVERQPFRVPGGVSWGVPVPAGRSVNLVATRGDVTPGRPWLAVGAHLDTVPQAPGAEDNASGVGALLAVAEATAGRVTRLPVVLLAFGAEEPRGPGDDDHHYGSRAYVAGLAPEQRDALRGMVSLDRVGVGAAVPACAAVPGDDPTLRSLLRAAARAGVPTTTCSVLPNRSSDHWSFVREGLPGARLGGASYAGYHSPADVPSVVDARQLGRAARIVVAWLR